jgi:hypothetical protein
MNVEIGAEAALFPEKEYINGIAVTVYTVYIKPKEYFKQSCDTFSSLVNQFIL